MRSNDNGVGVNTNKCPTSQHLQMANSLISTDMRGEASLIISSLEKASIQIYSRVQSLIAFWPWYWPLHCGCKRYRENVSYQTNDPEAEVAYGEIWSLKHGKVKEGYEVIISDMFSIVCIPWCVIPCTLSRAIHSTVSPRVTVLSKCWSLIWHLSEIRMHFYFGLDWHCSPQAGFLTSWRVTLCNALTSSCFLISHGLRYSLRRFQSCLWYLFRETDTHKNEQIIVLHILLCSLRLQIESG